MSKRMTRHAFVALLPCLAGHLLQAAPPGGAGNAMVRT